MITGEPSYFDLHLQEEKRLRKEGQKGYLMSFFIIESPTKGYIEGKQKELRNLKELWETVGGETTFYNHLFDSEIGALERHAIFRKTEHIIGESESDEKKIKGDLKKRMKNENLNFSIYTYIANNL